MLPFDSTIPKRNETVLTGADQVLRCGMEETLRSPFLWSMQVVAVRDSSISQRNNIAFMGDFNRK